MLALFLAPRVLEPRKVPSEDNLIYFKQAPFAEAYALHAVKIFPKPELAIFREGAAVSVHCPHASFASLPPHCGAHAGPQGVRRS